MVLGGAFDPIIAACSLPSHRRAFVADPASPNGWFGGMSVVAADPVRVIESCGLDEVACVLEETFDGRGACVATALVPYDAPATLHVYDAAYVGHAGEWKPVGSPPSLTESGRHAILGPALLSPIAELDESAFSARVAEVQRAISAGYVYVLNLTYRVRGVPAGTPGQTFLRLAHVAPASMQALFVSPRSSVASVSPERFLSVCRQHDGSRVARIEPVKGTAPRADGPRDLENARDLASSFKERAEHVMIVDLERNDLGRVCVPGTIAADPLLDVVATPYCHQMVSTVQGAMLPEITFAQLLASTFPCGSVTGAPKRSALRHIVEFESSRRGVYTGSLIVAMPGKLDSSVLIRTLEYSGGAGLWGTGCGITIDSDSGAEWRESVLKTWPVLAEEQAGYSAG